MFFQVFLNFVKTQTEIVRMTGDGQLADVEIHNISKWDDVSCS